MSQGTSQALEMMRQHTADVLHAEEYRRDTTAEYHRRAALTWAVIYLAEKLAEES